MDDLLERIEMALGAMASRGPKDLHAFLRQLGPIEPATDAEIEAMLDMILSEDPNEVARLRFSDLLRSWDNAKNGSWIADTTRNTEPRRERIHELLKSDAGLKKRIDEVLPFYNLEEPVVIAESPSDWYKPEPGVRDYYWRKYTEYLRNKKGWSDEAILNLDNSTRVIVENLANPEAKEAYASRGLVMGYVQSGKTANFAGVVARATDAGYRLVIILAGTWNILRNQTQRRFDKELLGKELLQNDETYIKNPPGDWVEFLEHGDDPLNLGQYSWQRLTRPTFDFKKLKASIDTLEYERRNKARPIYHPENLHALPVKLLVVKKHSSVLQGLVSDLGMLKTRLVDLPTLIIDDESDQAGINTIDPLKRKPGQERSKTNQRIVELLRLFPRGQYVGYTATPYANALIDPTDPEDLFPRDFIVSLDRPNNYMGVSDFFDATTDYDDLARNDFSLPEIAYIRRVSNPHGQDDMDLSAALRSYLLSGAVKLFRQDVEPSRYKPSFFKHHTMLLHTSSQRGEHTSLASRVAELWNRCAFNTAQGLKDLEQLWENDFKQVSLMQAPGELHPKRFDQLIPFLGETIKRIEEGNRLAFVLNSDSSDAPNFEEGPVWKIIIGGNKLSRGYTVEGLTVSYYRRVSNTADTLMQMGRWFGFRPGHRDLVRVFLGVNEGKDGQTDLVSLFKEVCRMEEDFRAELRRYVRTPDAPRITPKQIPPLIAITGSLSPTAKNKMFNAQVISKNFGGKWSMATLAPANPEAMAENLELLKNMLSKAKALGRKVLGGASGDKQIASDSLVYELTNNQLFAFLKEYRWLESDYKKGNRPQNIELQLEFLQKQDHGIKSWALIAPQRQESFGDPIELSDFTQLSVKQRRRDQGRGFRVFGESAHRRIAEFLVGLELAKPKLVSPNAATKALKEDRRGVMLLYLVREQKNNSVSVGFELVFPTNKLPFDLRFTVRNGNAAGSVTIPADT